MSQSKNIFEAKGLPIFQNKVFSTEEGAKASAVRDITLEQNAQTGIVENTSFEPSDMEYDESYQNEQALSKVFQQHLNQVTEILRNYFSSGMVLEIGCGKGFFLNHLKSSGFNAMGVDPAYEGDDKSVVKDYFHRDLGLKGDYIVLRHVLEHIKDPVAFLQAIGEANHNQGLIYIEVPCFDWILENNAWYDIFYEHVNYFRVADFRKIFGKIHEIGHLFGGQYLYVIADISSLQPPEACEAFDTTAIDGFQAGLDRLVAGINSKQQRQVGQKIGLWGCSSKGVILSIYLRRAGVDIDVAVDINAEKQGKHMAVSGKKILSPEQAREELSGGDLLIVSNANYLDEIVQMTENRYEYMALS